MCLVFAILSYLQSQCSITVNVHNTVHLHIGSKNPLQTLIDLHANDVHDTARFCQCIKLDKQLCDEVESRNHGDLKKKMEAAWFNTHTDEPTWEEIVDILVCMKKVHDAKRIADQAGVKFVHVDQYRE